MLLSMLFELRNKYNSNLHRILMSYNQKRKILTINSILLHTRKLSDTSMTSARTNVEHRCIKTTQLNVNESQQNKMVLDHKAGISESKLRLFQPSQKQRSKTKYIKLIGMIDKQNIQTEISNSNKGRTERKGSCYRQQTRITITKQNNALDSKFMSRQQHRQQQVHRISNNKQIYKQQRYETPIKMLMDISPVHATKIKLSVISKKVKGFRNY